MNKAIYFAVVCLVTLVLCLADAPASIQAVALWAVWCLVWLLFVDSVRARQKTPPTSADLNEMKFLHDRLERAGQAWTRAWHERLDKQTLVTDLEGERTALLTFIERATQLETQDKPAGMRLLNAMLAEITETRLPEANRQLLQALSNITQPMEELREAVAAAKLSPLATGFRARHGEVGAFQTAILHAEGTLEIYTLPLSPFF